MKNTAYVLGFITGLMLVAVVTFVIRAIAKKNNRPAGKYDERQQLLRGRAYKSAFWVLVAYLFFNGFFNLITGIEWADLMTGTTIGIFLSLTIFVVACIKNDAYFAINQKPRFYIVIFSICIAVNLAVGIINLYSNDEPFLTGGKLNFNILNFIVVLMFIAVLIALFLKKISVKKSNDRSEL